MRGTIRESGVRTFEPDSTEQASGEASATREKRLLQFVQKVDSRRDIP